MEWGQQHGKGTGAGAWARHGDPVGTGVLGTEQGHGARNGDSSVTKGRGLGHGHGTRHGDAGTGQGARARGHGALAWHRNWGQRARGWCNGARKGDVGCWHSTRMGTRDVAKGRGHRTPARQTAGGPRVLAQHGDTAKGQGQRGWHGTGTGTQHAAQMGDTGRWHGQGMAPRALARVTTGDRTKGRGPRDPFWGGLWYSPA